MRTTFAPISHIGPFSLITLGLLVVLAVPVQAVTFTTDTYIAADDFTYDGDDIVVDGCVVTIDGAHGFASLWVMPGGVVTHTAEVAGFALTTTGDATIDAGGAIDVDGKGYGPRSGPGVGDDGLTAGGGGGGYGGLGGTGFGNGLEVDGGIAYGSVLAPTELGSGGGGPSTKDPGAGAVSHG